MCVGLSSVTDFVLANGVIGTVFADSFKGLDALKTLDLSNQ
jgi:hypothetical protein